MTASSPSVAEALDIITVTDARPVKAFGPAYLELDGADGPMTVKLGSAEAAEAIIRVCERYVELTRWQG